MASATVLTRNYGQNRYPIAIGPHQVITGGADEGGGVHCALSNIILGNHAFASGSDGIVLIGSKGSVVGGGVAIGQAAQVDSNGEMQGVAIGNASCSFGGGVAIGYNARAHNDGIAIGNNIYASTRELIIGAAICNGGYRFGISSSGITFQMGDVYIYLTAEEFANALGVSV